MPDPYDSFVVFAEMRTGSNFLEANLNAIEGITCHGEAFNPYFIGYPQNHPILGVTLEQRDGDPETLLRAIREQEPGLGGFRYFHDHDPRVFDAIIADRRCAKIVLTRNPVESYVSWKIAQQTGQWKLTDMKARKPGQAQFDADEFDRHLEALQQFQVTLLNRLQTSGQSAFYIAYEDLQNVEVMNGLAQYLGVEGRLQALDRKLKKQNPSPIAEKVSNFDEMRKGLAALDRFDLTRTPNFEPRRGPVVPSYVAAESALLYLPIKGGPEQRVTAWLAALDGVEPEALRSKMSQKELRQWKRRHPGHRSFTVLRHPLDRAHTAFCRHILHTGHGSYRQLRNTLIRRYDLPLPPDGPGADYDADSHRAAFVGFLRFLKGNLTGQTAIRVDAAWCSQAQALQGFGDLALPDRVIREAELQEELDDLAHRVGAASRPVPEIAEETPIALAAIYDDEIEDLAADVYQRDYMMFGFRRWR